MANCLINWEDMNDEKVMPFIDKIAACPDDDEDFDNMAKEFVKEVISIMKESGMAIDKKRVRANAVSGMIFLEATYFEMLSDILFRYVSSQDPHNPDNGLPPVIFADMGTSDAVENFSGIRSFYADDDGERFVDEILAEYFASTK